MSCGQGEDGGNNDDWDHRKSNVQFKSHNIPAYSPPLAFGTGYSPPWEATQFEGIARVAFRETKGSAPEIIALSEEAASYEGTGNVTVQDAFCHPRVTIGGFDAALLVVREFLRRACRNKSLWLRFRLVIHPQDELAGGLTDIEERALKELGLRLGASQVVVYQGATDLCDDAIVAMAARSHIDCRAVSKPNLS